LEAALAHKDGRVIVRFNQRTTSSDGTHAEQVIARMKQLVTMNEQLQHKQMQLALSEDYIKHEMVHDDKVGDRVADEFNMDEDPEQDFVSMQIDKDD
jgi:hypothetical protein